MFQFVFFDLDDTLLDFHQAEAIAVAKAFRAVGLTPTEEMVARYSQVNQLHWRRLERGELTREEVLVQRFVYLFRSWACRRMPRSAGNNMSNFWESVTFLWKARRKFWNISRPNIACFWPATAPLRCSAPV